LTSIFCCPAPDKQFQVLPYGSLPVGKSSPAPGTIGLRPAAKRDFAYAKSAATSKLSF